jgi:hypothetical protein
MMTGTFGRNRGSRINWWREAPPVLAVAGLAADYLSPPAMWTMVLPFAAVVLLLAMRRWALAATVFLLCSWVAIPTAARATFAVEEMRGEHKAFVIDGIQLQSLQVSLEDPCGALTAVRFPTVDVTTLPVGPGHLINPRWALRESIVTFAELHNLMVIERWEQDHPVTCDFLVPDDDAR